MSKPQRRKCAPPFMLVIEGMLITANKVVTELPEGDSLRLISTAYPAELAKITSVDKVDRSFADWSYARWMNTHLRTHLIFEVAISPVVSQGAGIVMNGFMKILQIRA